MRNNKKLTFVIIVTILVSLFGFYTSTNKTWKTTERHLGQESVDSQLLAIGHTVGQWAGSLEKEVFDQINKNIEIESSKSSQTQGVEVGVPNHLYSSLVKKSKDGKWSVLWSRSGKEISSTRTSGYFFLKQISFSKLGNRSHWVRVKDKRGLAQYALVFPVSRASGKQGWSTDVNPKESPTAFMVGIFDEPFKNIIELFKGSLLDLMLINENGIAIGHKREAYAGNSIAGDPTFKLLKEHRERNSFFDTVEKDGESRFAGFRRIQGSNLVVTAGMSRRGFLQSQVGSLINIIVLSFALMLLSIVFVRFFGSRVFQFRALPAKTKSQPLKVEEVVKKDSKIDVIEEPVKPQMTADFKLLRNIAGGIANQLIGPTSSVLGHLRILGHTVQGQPEKQYLDTVQREMKKVKFIAETLNDVGQTSVGRRKLVDFKSIVTRVIAEFEKETLGSSLRINKKLSDVPRTLANETQIATVVRTLLRNAVLAVKLQTKKEITVSLEISDRAICLKVRDTGVTGASEIEERLFEPFLTNMSGDGSALSLPQAYAIANNHKGNIFYNPTLTTGNEAHFVMPVDITAQAESELSVVQKAEEAPLIVEQGIEEKNKEELAVAGQVEVRNDESVEAQRTKEGTRKSPGVRIRRPKVKDLQL
jgi:signal transduction histidine kinase